MMTSWAGLPDGMRHGKRCITDGCDREPVWTMTRGDVSSDYCGPCKLRMYELGARGSGRTSRMIEKVRAGEAVVCLNGAHASHVIRVLRERGIVARVVTCGPDVGDLARTLDGYRGAVHLDHCWVHEWYSASIINATRDLEGVIASCDRKVSQSEVSRHIALGEI